ncbi:hypothetical protein EPN90_03235 [Patescibacteria group bacterium]|nr:MAG: hypothetical protein EPN90_03235 [Patescibacteria group bacterium]
MSSLNIILLAFSFGLMLIGGFYALAQFLSIFTGAPYVPTSSERTAAMIALAGLQPGELAVDLGAGDGRLVLAAAATGARAEGFELNPLLVFLARFAIRRASLAARAKIHRASFRGADLRRASVIFIYLLPGEMARLERWLPAALNPGARVVVNAFPFPHWKPEAKQGNLYRYRVP